MGEGHVRKANQPSRLFSNKVVHLLYGSLHVWGRLLKTQAKINVLKMIRKLSEEMLLKRRCDFFFFNTFQQKPSQHVHQACAHPPTFSRGKEKPIRGSSGLHALQKKITTSGPHCRSIT